MCFVPRNQDDLLLNIMSISVVCRIHTASEVGYRYKTLHTYEIYNNRGHEIFRTEQGVKSKEENGVGEWQTMGDIEIKSKQSIWISVN